MKGKYVRQAIDDWSSILVGEIKKETPVDSGKLRKNIKASDIVESGSRFSFRVYVGGGVKYGNIVLNGSKPHKIKPKTKKALAVPGLGVYKSVQHPGTKANDFVGRGVSKSIGRLEDMLGDAIKKDILDTL